MLSGLFKKIIHSLFKHNSWELQKQRKALAAGNSYYKQIEKIEIFLEFKKLKSF